MAKKAILLSDLPVVGSHVPFPYDSEMFHKGAVILMDKPTGWSSFDLVKFVRNRIPPKKVGHAGTLDPLATGLLILCCGKATKSISQIQDLEKTYVTTIRFGASTPSFDAATKIDQHAPWEHITAEAIQKRLSDSFSGVISQVPPIYSAISVKGQRLYKIARKGGDVQIDPRDVTIYETEVLDISLPDITLKVRCGKGTYIRSLAHDLGIALNSRAHITSLRRTTTGQFHVDNAYTTEQFEDAIKSLEDNG